MRSILTEYAIALVVFLAIDFIWLAFIARGIYAAEIGGLLRDRPNFAVAFLFYLLFVAGLVYFVIHSATSIAQALLAGAFFGLVAYGTYDLTNLATIRGFTLRIALIDLAWGASVAGAVSAITVWFVQRFNLAA